MYSWSGSNAPTSSEFTGEWKSEYITKDCVNGATELNWTCGNSFWDISPPA